MFEKTYRFLKFLEESGEVQGRKKLQKMVHLLQNMKLDFGVNYAYHHYGPYSADLQIFLDALVDKNLVKEDYFEGIGAYKYKLTDKGQKLIDELEKNYEELAEFTLPKKELEELKKQSSPFLEVLSTYTFLIQNGYSQEEAVKKTKKLKPELKDYIKKAQEYYEWLNVS